MIGIFHIFMWYFLLVLYMGQIKGVFGTYEPITYKTGCAFWGVFYIVSGVSSIRSTQNSSRYLKLGREVSRILLTTYLLEIAIAFAHAICCCSQLATKSEDVSINTEDIESSS
uniref:Membrane spanning 4-domains A13 n=1 Tax=Sciurus vulgaris TaxID=55149 RepID=A0A8D2CSP0_SCIVU